MYGREKTKKDTTRISFGGKQPRIIHFWEHSLFGKGLKSGCAWGKITPVALFPSAGERLNRVRRSQHSPLYHRNTLLAWGFLAFLLAFSLLIQDYYLKVAWLIPTFLLNYLVWANYRAIHPTRLRLPMFTPGDSMLHYETITFPSRDGLQIAAWYVPSKNRAAVILVHGSGGNKATLLNQLRLLAMDGFGVLALDLRAHGDSQGDTITGVHEAQDVLGGLDYLKTRPDVDADKIGALGISLGAVVVLRAARETGDLRALILESLGPIGLKDHGGPPLSLRRKINYPLNWFMYKFGDWMCGATPPETVCESLPHLWPRPLLLISTGTRLERHFNRIFFEAAREPKSLWEATRASHAAAYVFETDAYKEKVRGFFRDSLLNTPQQGNAGNVR